MSNATKDPKATTHESAGCCCGCGADKPATDANELTDEQMAQADGGYQFLSVDGPAQVDAEFLSVNRKRLEFLSADGADRAERII